MGFAISGVRSVPPYSIDLREIRLDLHYNLFYNVYIISFSIFLGGCVWGVGEGGW